MAIRITRPQTTEDEFLEQELETISRTSVTLLGAQPRPQGVVLRFELVLASGLVVMRGEGRVVGFKPNAYRGMGGLTLRFTRLDTRSKAMVDKASALRERRRPSAQPPAVEPSPSLPPAVVEETRPPVFDVEATRAEAPSSKRSGHPPHALPAMPVAPAPPQEPTPRQQPPRERDALLDKLRARAKSLDATAVQRILEQRQRRA
ncbi:MAG TPA: hypothetical protein VIF09_26470 [Polyangiaceae bacterium]